MDQSDFKKFKSQLWTGLIIAFVSFMVTTIILTNTNATEIVNVKQKNIEQDSELYILKERALQKEEFMRLFNILREDIHEIKQDLKNQ